MSALVFGLEILAWLYVGSFVLLTVMAILALLRVFTYWHVIKGMRQPEMFDLFDQDEFLTTLTRVCYAVYHEVRPVAFYGGGPAYFILPFLPPHNQVSTWEQIIYWATGVYLAWLHWRLRPNDHDDRWKRRRKKARERIERVGNRLVVVPVPSPA